MLYTKTVLGSTLDLLKELQSLPELANMRLVGGTALALQLGHRSSIDIDLFGRFDPSCSFRQLLINRGHRVEGSENGEIQTLSVDDVKVDLVNYPYDWISDSVCESGTILAGLDDIVAMKLSAAANRGKKKDFIDIAILLDRYPLSAMFELYRHKFQIHDIAFALRGITYFDDAEADPMPVMHCTLTWEQTKKKISSAVRSFVKFE